MTPRSIRWSLLAWYAAILVVVLAGFSLILSWQLWRSMTAEVDAELRARAEGLEHALEVRDGEVSLPSEALEYFRGGGEDAPYCAVWDANGRLLIPSAPETVSKPEGTGLRERGYHREVVVHGPGGALILVGRGTHERSHHLREFVGMVLGAGAFVLAVALAGGWLIARRALAPIGRMSETAARISAQDLSARIPLEGTASELEQLARVLNDAFARLQEAFERQTRFTADASHELRTPLSIVMSHLELALRKERSAAEYREAIETAFRGAERMRAVVEGLLTLARADAGTLLMARDRIDLRAAVEETVAMLSPMASERRIGLQVSIEPATIVGDRDRLREVVTNLLTNAIRYNREGGRVDLGLRVEGGHAVLSVSDTGIGIPEAEQGRLFERFYRVDKVRSREIGGSGLGLSIAKWIVEAHGGTIRMASREGQGATFTVRLPAAP